jgi:hypothetical protein
MRHQLDYTSLHREKEQALAYSPHRNDRGKDDIAKMMLQ